MYYFGGCKDHGYVDCLFKYNLRSGQTEPLYTSLERPSPRSAHSAVVYKNHMYIFGGWNGSQSYGDFHRYSFAKNKWSVVKSTGSTPFKRRAHCAVVNKDAMYLFGGFDSEQDPDYFNQLHKFHFGTKEWSEVPLSGDVPSGRSRCSMVEYNNKLYLFGGWDRKTHFNHLYEIDTEEQTSKLLHNNSSQFIDGIGQHTCVVYKDWMVVFGGYIAGKDKNDCSNEMFLLKLF